MDTYLQAVKFIFPRKENGIYARTEILHGIWHMVPTKEILGLGMLQMYFKWSVLIKKPAAELLKVRKFTSEDRTKFVATGINAKEISVKMQWLPLCISNAEVAEFLTNFGKPIQVVHEHCEEEELRHYYQK